MSLSDINHLTLEAITEFSLAEHTAHHPRIEAVAHRRLTAAELSAVESMESEHASYGSSKFYLQTLLPTRGFNHPASIGDEAAAVVVKGDGTVIAYSSESHNSPSYVCAHPGAATGTGGNERDNIALTGNKPLALFESRRQGHPRHNLNDDPIRQHTDETTKGIGDYGNAMGIPHGDGAIKYDPRYAGNNLVNVMAFSVGHQDRLLTNKVPTTDHPSKFVAIYVGKASDDTGVGGTKFASVATDMENTDLNEKAVQDPDPHLQESVTMGIERLAELAYEEGWADRFSIKDMGAAGLLCSTVEQLHGDIGVAIDGRLVPQQGQRSAIELLEAETQERFLVYVHEDHAQQVLDVFNHGIGLPHINTGAAAAVIGRCNDSGRYTFLLDGERHVDLPAEDLMAGPLLRKPVRERFHQRHGLPELDAKELSSYIRNVLSSINFKSDAYIHDHYDKHVQSTNIVNRGEGPATLRTHPRLAGIGISASFDSNTVYGLIDPKFQAEDSFVRGAYKMALVGASVIGVTNNANYGRTDIPEEMWEFAKGQEGVAKACYNWPLELEYLFEVFQDPATREASERDERRHVTVNSGNCSLNKANKATGSAIPPTTILGLVGWSKRPENHLTWRMSTEDSKLYLIGARQRQLAGSELYQSSFGPDKIGNELFTIDYEKAHREVKAVIDVVRNGVATAGNYISEGGLLTAAAEMVAHNDDIAMEIQARARMSRDQDLTEIENLFSESHGVILQIPEQNIDRFHAVMNMHELYNYFHIGYTVAADEGSLDIRTKRSNTLSQEWIAQTYRHKLTSMLGDSL